MRRTTPVPILLALLSLAPPLVASLEAQSPDAATLSELPEGLRVRTNGPGVRDVIRPSLGDVLQGGLMTLLIRPAADGVVVAATPDALRFAPSRRGELVAVPWSGIDYVDAHGGRSVPLGMLQGTGYGALMGLVSWGLIELIFMAADNPVVDDPEAVIGIGAAAGALVGAATLGDRWSRVYPASGAR